MERVKGRKSKYLSCQLFTERFYKCDILEDFLWFIELLNIGFNPLDENLFVGLEDEYNEKTMYFISVGKFIHTQDTGHVWVDFDVVFDTEDQRDRCLTEIRFFFKILYVTMLKRIGLLPYHEWEVMEYLGYRTGPGIGGVS